MLSLICFFAVLSVLVIIHELGHFLAAKKIGVRVEVFSLGFGPKLFSIKKGDTEYRLSAIPLGGYVKMAGDDPGEKITGARWEFLSRRPIDRLKIIVAGPIFNYLLAFLIFSAIFMIGSPTMTTEIGGLLADYPAAKSGLLLGDKILSVDGQNVKYWEDMTRIIHGHAATPLRLQVDRSGSTMEISIAPIVREVRDIFGKKTSVALIGVSPSQKIEQVRYGFLESLGMGFTKVVDLTAVTYKALFSVITGQLSVKESMTGPVGIFVITGQAAKLGVIYLAHLMAILSASLAIFNLLPFPVLDGGHVIFLALEKLRGKPLSLKAQERIANIGVALLIALTVFIFYNDVIKFKIVEKVMGIFAR